LEPRNPGGRGDVPPPAGPHLLGGASGGGPQPSPRRDQNGTAWAA